MGNGGDGRALGGVPEQVGTFMFHVPTQLWRWSDEVYRIYGFSPGEVVPTTELLMAHKHPDDIARTQRALVAALRTGDPFSCRHRVIDARGAIRTVVAVGRGVLVDGKVVQLHGYLVDVTASLRQDIKAEADAAVRAATEHRSVIDQAKGALMLALGVDEEVAFALLAARSQAVNVKLRAVASRLVEDIAEGRLTSGTAEAMTDWLCADVVPRVMEVAAAEDFELR